MLWDYLSFVIGNWDGEVVIMGDFNEVRDISESISSTSLDRFLSDHRPIIMREAHYDYGPIPFKFFHYWFELDGFDKLVDQTWLEANEKYSKAELADLDGVIDKGEGSDAEGHRRREVVRLIQEVEKNDDLEREVSNEEIKMAVWVCGIDKAPGPDGFTFGFYRRYWDIIGNDVVDAVPNANMVKDFRPISLIGSLYKVIAKVLANRLVTVLDDIVDEIQSAFVSDRQILDGPFILNEIVHWCKNKKKQSMIFKVDFEKAYDSVRWDFIDDILRRFGFGEKWCKWIQSCLYSSRGSVLVNGSPTKEFQFHKGLKQGDPLSPFLFILVMESLHVSFQRVVDAGLFNGIKLDSSLQISHLFYADDAIFMGQWSQCNIDTIIRVLDVFYRASGLRINMNKSNLMGISVDSNKVKHAAAKIGCLVLKTPFNYLGSRVGDLMSRIQSWHDVTEGMQTRLSKWKLKTLSIGGRLTLLKSVLGAILIYHMSIFKVPMRVLQNMESIRARFFNGTDVNSKKPSWVRWKSVLVDKDVGGLGVSSLFALNRAHMFKWVWRFFSQKKSLWVRVIKALHGEDGKIGKKVQARYPSTWLNIINEIESLKLHGIDLVSFITPKLGNGVNTSFWDVAWCGDIAFKNLVPRLYALESMKNIEVASKLSHGEGVTLSNSNDRWSLSLVGSGDFSVSSVRKLIDNALLPKGISKTRWVKEVPIKINVHAWKVIHDCLPTRFNISRRGMEIESILCPMCECTAESSRHLFFSCKMISNVMRKITRWWDLEYMEINSFEDWCQWISSIRLPVKQKHVFEGICYIVWWYTWNRRSLKIFGQEDPSMANVYDEVVYRSFYWIRFRCKAKFSFIDCLKNPNLILL
ncbi:RNA-directed DNA polymerase, eukaryota, reverse transcriptase zinc-binding domain protein [Tanacetum coccineum]